MLNKTKVIATIGPSTAEKEQIKRLMENGVDVVRLNMSHANYNFCKDIIDKVNSFNIKARSDSNWIDECLQVLREGLAEFPKNEDLLITLSETLCEAGYRKFNEHSYYDEQGIRKHNYTEHNKNKYWQEAIKIS